MLQQAEFSELKAKAHPTRFPKKLSPDYKQHITLMGGFGIRLGDVILGLQSAHVLRKMSGRRLTYHAYIVHDPNFMVSDLYDLFDGATYQYLPFIHKGKPEIDADFCDPFYRYEFKILALQDFFFDLMGMNWKDIPAKDKKPSWLAEKISGNTQFKDTIWLVPKSSDPLRSFSDDLVRRILDLSPLIKLMPRLKSSREYLESIAGCYALISTDTSAYHAAAAWDKPTCVIFGQTRIIQDGYDEIHNISASKRIGYYANATAVELLAPSMPFTEKEDYIIQSISGWLMNL